MLDGLGGRVRSRTSHGVRRDSYLRLLLQGKVEEGTQLAALELRLKPAPERVHRPAAVRAVHCRALPPDDASPELACHLRHQARSIGIVVVQEGLAHATLGRDRGHGRARDAIAYETPDCCIQDPGAGPRAGALGDPCGCRHKGTTARDIGATGSEEAIPIVEEQLRVSKRETAHGRVRIRSYVVETPVQEQVTLHEERLQVERHPVDRPVGAADDVFRDKTIEATETGEEAVVSKEARVKEEVVVRKTAEERTETVSDTVRRTEVEVEDERGRTSPTGPGTTPRSNDPV